MLVSSMWLACSFSLPSSGQMPLINFFLQCWNETQATHRLGKCLATELQFQPEAFNFNKSNLAIFFSHGYCFQPALKSWLYSPVFLLKAFKYLKFFLNIFGGVCYISMYLFWGILLVIYVLQRAQGGQRPTCKSHSLPPFCGSQGSHSGHQVTTEVILTHWATSPAQAL